jgi:hypothetical protein
LGELTIADCGVWNAACNMPVVFWGHGDMKAAFMTGAGPNSIAWRVETDDAE